jgi:hypothetical protein
MGIFDMGAHDEDLIKGPGLAHVFVDEDFSW